jgi:ABC-type amino acid transport substrate-binding protein
VIQRISGLLLCALFAACTSAPPPVQSPSGAPSPTVAATTPGSSPSPAETPSSSLEPSISPSPSGSVDPSSGASQTPLPSGLDAQLITPGTLTTCVSVVGLPAAGLTEEGQLDGYNVAFATEIAARMGLELAIVQPLFEDLMEEVTTSQCDVAISSLNITAERSTEVSFVPYTRSTQPVVVTSGNPQTIDSLESLCGLAVSAATGTTHVDLVEGLGDYAGQGLSDSCTTAGDQPIDLQTFPTELEAVTALLDGEVVAYLGNPNYVFEFPDELQYAEASLPPARQGMAVALERPAVLEAIQSTFQSMLDDGVYRGILIQYLPNQESVDAVSILTPDDQ